MKIFSHKEKYFIWSGISPQGKKITGETQALSINQVKSILLRQEIKPITISQKKTKWFYQINKNISDIDISIFFRQLSALISAGVPIVQSCDIIRQSQDKMTLRILIHSIQKSIESGKNLLDELIHYPKYFDDLTCHLIHVGEQTGTLEIMLKRIANHKEKSLTLQKQIKQALFYPSIIFLVALLVCFIMIMFVVPRFADLFQSMQGKLPIFTLIIIHISNFFHENIWICFIPIIFIGLLTYLLKTSKQAKQIINRILHYIPVVKTSMQKIILAQFAHSLAITLGAGIPIIEALKIATNTTRNYHYVNGFNRLMAHVAAGKNLYSAMQLNSLFPTMIIQMVKIGEESGTLESMLQKIAELYENDISHLIATLSHLLEPLIMIILGVLIGGLVIAMYLPIFKLGTII